MLALALHEFPAQLTRDDLKYKGIGSGQPLEQAIKNLALAGLLWCEGDVVLPTSQPSLRLAGGIVNVGRSFGANLVACRRRAGLSQEALGFRASLHRTEGALLERGARVPRIDTLIKLTAALDIPPGDPWAG